MTQERARELAWAHLEKWYGEAAEGIELSNRCVERAFGWVFFYNSKEFYRTRREEDCIIGAAPLIVDRSTSLVHATGTARPLEHYLEKYEEEYLRRPAGN